LDDLAARVFSFRQNYCFGSNSGAVCVPSRAMLMTGKYWLHTNERMDGELILPQLLRQNGYTTFATGKWHNQPPALLRGFEQASAIYLGGMCDHTEVFVQDISRGQLTNRRTGKKYSSELFAAAAIDFLESYESGNPFFAYVAFTAPHDPRQPPMKYRQMYYENRPPLPRNFLPQHPFDNGHMRGGRDENLAAWPRTEAVVSDQLAEYYGLITHLDDQIGRILRALKTSAHERNTIVVYAADHGLAMGSHGLLGKQSVYEHSMKCPLIFVGPDIPANTSTQAFTYLLDVYPTLCALLGIESPTGLVGHDLSAIWQGREDHVRDSVFLPFQNVQRAVRDERWKLICYPQINHRQLFDLQADPDELHDLAGSDEHAVQVERMLALMKQWQERLGDRQPLTVTNSKRKEVDLTGRPRLPDRWQPKWIRDKYFDGVEPTASDKAAQETLRREYADG
jgi:arylsulfatase A-like enzyme